MANPVSSIAKGMTALYDGPMGRPLANLKGGPTTPQSLKTLSELSESVSGRFQKRLRGLENDVIGQRKKLETAAEELGMSGKAKHESVKSKANDARRAIVKRTDAERYAMISEMHVIETQVVATEMLFESAAHLLMQSGLGSNQRSELLRQIEGSGPKQLENYGRLAVAKNDKVMGAVVAGLLDKLPKDQRDRLDVSRTVLADELCGEEYNAAKAEIAIVRNRLREGLAANRRFERGGDVEAKGVHRLTEQFHRQDEAAARPEESEENSEE